MKKLSIMNSLRYRQISNQTKCVNLTKQKRKREEEKEKEEENEK
jgi:hypothetical protein